MAQPKINPAYDPGYIDGDFHCEASLERVAEVVESAGHPVQSLPFLNDLGRIENHYIDGLCGDHHRARLREVREGVFSVRCFTCSPTVVVSHMLNILLGNGIRALAICKTSNHRGGDHA